MTENQNDSLELIKEMEQKGRQKAAQAAIFPRWVAFLLSALGGLGFALLVEFGWPGTLVIPVMFLIFIIHYRRAKAWPYFWPTKAGLNRTKQSLRVTTPAYWVFLIFVFCGIFSFPFMFIKALEFKDSGYVWTSYAGGFLITVFNFILCESDRYFLRKNS